MNRFEVVTYVWRHKKALYQLWKTHDTKVTKYRVIMHDTIKMINILLIGDKLATKIHRRFARHHNIETHLDFCEAYLDFASARLTKPDKQMDAIQTFEANHIELYTEALNHYKEVQYK